ncbi:hypothetical protein EON65_03860 [archaeon]|nr:MAG: hypothetical protein EON65_03860 [archaeon]
MSDWDSEPDQRGSVPLFASRSEANVDNIYEEKGFFFRQRRGRFNLRKLDQIELDRLVREVDIQTLQEHLEDLTFSIFNEDDLQFYTDRQVVKLFRLAQLTIEYLLYSQTQLVSNMHELSKKYAVKKKTLHRKRRELVGLKEEVTSLYGQLKAKRRNLTTLEKLVKETGKALRPSPQEEPSYDKPISFYVSLPNNVFMELTERPSATVRNILSQVMNVLLTDRNFDPLAHFGSLEEMQASPQNVLQLFSKGKLLLLDSSLVQCHVQSGDTLVAAYPLAKAAAKPSAKPAQEAAKAVERPATVQDTGVMTGINDIIGKQLQSMEQLAAEMK